MTNEELFKLIHNLIGLHHETLVNLREANKGLHEAIQRRDDEIARAIMAAGAALHGTIDRCGHGIVDVVMTNNARLHEAIERRDNVVIDGISGSRTALELLARRVGGLKVDDDA